MGNDIVCRYQQICGGEVDSVQNGTLDHPISIKLNNQAKIINQNYLEKNQIENINKIQISRSVTRAKPSPKFISSNDAYNNFFYILNNIIKIQKMYRNYILRIRKKMKFKASSTIGKCVPSNDDYPVNNETNLNCNGNLSNANMTSLFKKPTTMTRSSLSHFSRTMSSISEAVVEGSIKGNFLKKNMRFKYKGGLLNKKKEGYGRVTWEDGSILFANFENSRAKGFCKFIDVQGSVFTGLYDNNKPNGYGICNLNNNNVKFEGCWVKNIQNGIGIEIWDDESYYQGEFENSKKKGIGLYRWPDGTIYKGEWINNKMNGYGMIYYPDDRTYFGQVSNGEINGFGEFSWKDGGRYIGNYVKEQKEGFGVFIWNKKPVTLYVGFWHDGKQNGVGIKISNGVGKYGIWKEGRHEYWLQGHWVINQHLKPNQTKFEKFFGQTIPSIVNLFNP